ncbi:hypothetical protein [Actinacidiphila glaucinigra]|uniref:Uncharacterized protein n=1 Tax=Actinacidiphila glaucinigra TaxID=235986 RepID=A0A239DAF6_9ACTN|nr:hypothetical protein [Actinacidiphila glaucinigra]SNS29217.1 hypothetical protein SAMN05216252_104466 [Actinacidiphila glaucinigra]
MAAPAPARVPTPAQLAWREAGFGVFPHLTAPRRVTGHRAGCATVPEPPQARPVPR